jgi:aldehyde:ferredoxin oxidoreductase
VLQHACHFKSLRIDLDCQQASQLEIDPQVILESIGGTGLGVQMILQTDSAELDAFDRRSSIFFVFSPLVGSPLTTSAKFSVVSKSPLTHRINDSLAGSGFAIAGKKTGFDVIEVTGRASKPVVIIVENGSVKFEPADTLWGKTVTQAESALRSKYGPKFRSALIGPAGENKVLYATISHDGRHAGRGGSGAVLGDKNIKAILVSGNRSVSWAHPQELNRFAKQLSKRSFGPATAKYRELGTAANLLVFNRLGCLPTRNFQESEFSGVEQLSPESLQVEREKVRSSCVACTIGCEHLYGIHPQSSKKPADRKVRIEYESLFAFGPLCGISDPETVLNAVKLCDEYGIDTISTGGTLAFAMECSQRGLWKNELSFGDGQSVLESIHRIAKREGRGDELANGSRQLAMSIGQQSIDFSPQIKGLEIPGYDPQKLTTMALGFAVGTRGADHNKSGAYEVDFQEDRESSNPFSGSTIEKAIAAEDKSCIMDSMIVCKFLRGCFEDFFSDAAEILRLVAGFDLSAADLRATGQQMVNRKKMFNIRAGWSPGEDTLPQRFFEKVEGKRRFFSQKTLAAAIKQYNLKRGWTPEGFLE